MVLLKCDVCGGTLSIDAGGKTATCEFCGAKHSIERMREKVMEIKGTVSIEGDVQVRQTGTREDILQWKKLLDKYMLAYDYKSALSIVNKILEANPSDEDINGLYDVLQELQYFDIRNGVLEKYNGNADKIDIPKGVRKVKRDAFRYVECKELVIPDTVEEWQSGCPRAVKIRFGENVKFVTCEGIWCDEAILRENCDDILPLLKGVKLLEVPEEYDGNPTLLEQYSELEEIRGSEKYKNNVINYDWLSAKKEYFPYNHYRLNKGRKIEQGGGWYDITRSPLIMPIVVKKITKERRNYKVCQYCGSEFTGIFTKVCPKCHREKDY